MKVRRHWRRIRAHRFAENPSIAKTITDAENLAWNAVWRTYDFSVEALQDRLKAENLYIQSHFWRDWSQNRVKQIGGTNFFVTHLPEIGPSGDKIIRTEKDVANVKHLIGQFTHKLLKDGTYLPETDDFERLYAETEDPYILCDVGGIVNLNRRAFNTSRFKNVTIPEGPVPVLTECSLLSITQTKPKRNTLPALSQLEGNLDDLRIAGSAEFSTPWKREKDFFPSGFTTRDTLTVSAADPARFNFQNQFSYVELNLSKSKGRSYLSGRIENLSLNMDSSTADLRFQKCIINSLKFDGAATCTVLMTDSAIVQSCYFMVNLPRSLDIRDSQIGTGPYGVALAIENPAPEPKPCESLSISGTRFEGSVSLDSLRFDAVHIKQSVFSRSLSMRNSIIVEDFSMTDSKALELDLACRQSLPEDQRTIGRLNLSGSTVKQTAQFDNRIFDGKAVFDGSTFGTPPQFYGATLSQDTSFRNVQILWEQELRTHGKPSTIIFQELRRSLSRKESRRAVTKSIIAKRRIFLGRLKGKTNLLERIRSRLHIAASTVVATLAAIVGQRRHKESVLQAFNSRNGYLAEVERAFRILREKMDAIRAPALAEGFGRDELRARHRRYGDKEVAIWEYVFGKIYSATTDYGASVGRPIVALGLLTLGMTMVYLTILQSFIYLGQAARVAMTITMRPLIHLGPAYGRGTPDCDVKLKPDADAFDSISFLTNCNEVAFKTLSFVHSIAIIVLLFFAISAIRRRFRII